MRHFWSGRPASRTVKRSLPMPMPGGEEGACPKAKPAQASVTTKAVFQFAENMASCSFARFRTKKRLMYGFLSFSIGPAEPTHKSDFEASARNADRDNEDVPKLLGYVKEGNMRKI